MISLVDSFRFRSPKSIAFVGAGGKTTCMFQLAKAKGDHSIITTSTHLGVDQIPPGMQHRIVSSAQEIRSLLLHPSEESIVITGPRVDEFRFGHPDEEALTLLHDQIQGTEYSLFIEADGSRTLPIKAPADHEPAISTWVDTVVTLFGCSGLGQPLSNQVVHRIVEYQTLSGLKEGELITVDAAAKVLTSPHGGLKRIPEYAERVLVLNQADDTQRQSLAGRLAELCLPAYDRVLITSLNAEPSPLIHARLERVAGILLAAGGSSRFGQPKQLLEVGGKPLVRKIAQIALNSGLSPVIVVVGHAMQEVSSALDDLPVQIIENPNWSAGQSTSIKAGVEGLPRNIGGVIFLLSDQPFLSEEVIRALVAEAQQTQSPVIAPLIMEQRGNPVYFDRDTLTDLSGLTGDQGGRAIFTRFPPHYLPWGDESLLFDIDKMEDMEQYRRLSHE